MSRWRCTHPAVQRLCRSAGHLRNKFIAIHRSWTQQTNVHLAGGEPQLEPSAHEYSTIPLIRIGQEWEQQPEEFNLTAGAVQVLAMH